MRPGTTSLSIGQSIESEEAPMDRLEVPLVVRLHRLWPVVSLRWSLDLRRHRSWDRTGR